MTEGDGNAERVEGGEPNSVELALSLLERGQLDLAWCAADQGIASVGSDRRQRVFWQFRFIRALVLVSRGRTHEALSYIESLGKPCDEDADSAVSLLMYRGYWLGIIGSYRLSLELLSDAETIASASNLFGLQGQIRVRQALVHYLLGDFAESRELYQSVLDTHGNKCGSYLYAVALGGIGKAVMAMGMFEEALLWLDKASEIARTSGFEILLAGDLSEIGVCYTGLGNLKKALEVHRLAEKILIGIGAMQPYQVNLADIGNVYLHKGDFLTAISYYRRALAIAEQIKHPASIEKWNYNIRLAYVKLRASIDQTCRP